MASLALVPHAGAGTLQLIGGTIPIELARDRSVESILPVPEWNETYAVSPDSEGGPRTRWQPENPTGAGKVWIGGTSAADVRENVATWEQTVMDANRYGAELTYTPTSGTAVIYDIESMRISAMPQDDRLLDGLKASSEFEFTTLPYGRLAGTTVVTDANGTAPLLEFTVPELSGSMDAFGMLTLTDTASQARLHIEGGMESRYYDSGSPTDLLMTRPDLTALESAGTFVRTGAYSAGSIIWRQTAGTVTKGIAYGSGSHTGRFIAKGRFYDSAGTISVRLGYSVRGGATKYNNWNVLPQNAAWTEVNLGIVDIDEAATGTHSVRFSVYAKAGGGTPTVDLDYVKLFPAERYFMARGSVGSVSTIRSGRYAMWRYDSVLSETANGVWAEHPAAEGSYLHIPPKGGRIAVAANRADIETAAHTPLGDALRADLTVTPRVFLLGA